MSETADRAKAAFPSAMCAKEFLASRIAAEALRQGAPLSELERQMLFFTESYETLPNMLDINAEFDEQYDSAEYEERIVSLIRSAYDRDAQSSPADRQRWNDAICRLESEDHYILVMAHAADLGGFDSPPGALGVLSTIAGFFKSRRS